eukprot:4212503-Amphidinium_carterae.1
MVVCGPRHEGSYRQLKCEPLPKGDLQDKICKSIKERNCLICYCAHQVIANWPNCHSTHMVSELVWKYYSSKQKHLKDLPPTRSLHTL